VDLHILLLLVRSIALTKPSGHLIVPPECFFITTYPALSRYLTSRFATMSAFRRSESCCDLRPSNLSANESDSARSSGVAGVSFCSGSVSHPSLAPDDEPDVP
jgi:hypothetical protein